MPSLHLTIGSPCGARVALRSRGGEDALVGLLEAHAAARATPFLHFGDGLHIALASRAEFALAAAMLLREHDAEHDADGWIAEAHAMEARTAEHMAAPSSDDDENSEECPE